MGRVHWKREELYKHGGCEGCVRLCKYNGLIATKEKAMLSKGRKFGCNISDTSVANFLSQKRKENKDENV